LKFSPHRFLFHEGRWIGEGKVTLSASPDVLRFYTCWNIKKKTKKGIKCLQEVEIQGSEPAMQNSFLLTDVKDNSFKIELNNDLLGSEKGKGIIDEKTIAWEFHGKESIEGFEVYELTDEGDYMLHAEYTSPDQYRTTIDGRIWFKPKPKA